MHISTKRNFFLFTAAHIHSTLKTTLCSVILLSVILLDLFSRLLYLPEQ